MPLHQIALLVRDGVVRSVLALAAVTPLLALAPAPIQGQQLSRERILRLTESHADLAFQTYRELLSLPNDALVPEDILRVTEWLETAFRARGFETERLAMPGSDALLATREVPAANRTVLIYLQADGQLFFVKAGRNGKRRAGGDQIENRRQIHAVILAVVVYFVKIHKS